MLGKAEQIATKWYDKFVKYSSKAEVHADTIGRPGQGVFGWTRIFQQVSKYLVDLSPFPSLFLQCY